LKVGGIVIVRPTVANEMPIVSPASKVTRGLASVYKIGLVVVVATVDVNVVAKPFFITVKTTSPAEGIEETCNDKAVSDPFHGMRSRELVPNCESSTSVVPCGVAAENNIGCRATVPVSVVLTKLQLPNITFEPSLIPATHLDNLQQHLSQILSVFRFRL